MQAARRLAERILQSAELRAFVGLSEGEARLIEPAGLVPDPVRARAARLVPDGRGPAVRRAERRGAGGRRLRRRDRGRRSRSTRSSASSRRRRARSSSRTATGSSRRCSSAGARRGQTRKPVDPDHRLPRGADDQGVPHHRRALPERRASSAVVEDPRKLDYKDGTALAQGRAVDLVYRRVLANEFLDREKRAPGALVAPTATAPS